MTPDFLNHVRNCFLIHVIECAECMAALDSGQATAPRPGQCGFLLDAGTTPPVLCPHERDGDAVWCALHIEAMVEAGGTDFAARAANGLAGFIGQADLKLEEAFGALQAVDRHIAELVSQDESDPDLPALRMNREGLIDAIARTYASKAEAEARAAALRRQAGQG